jgi:hypothetical protein
MDPVAISSRAVGDTCAASSVSGWSLGGPGEHLAGGDHGPAESGSQNAGTTVGERHGRRAVGDNHTQVMAGGGCLDQHVGAGGQPQATQPVGVHVWLVPQEVDRTGDVVLPAPTPAVRASLTFSGAAGVVEQNSVPVLGQQLGVLHRAVANAARAVHDDDRRPVLRGHVPPGQTQPVRRVEGDRLEGGPGWGCDLPSVHVGLHHPDPDRQHEELSQHRSGHHRDTAVDPSA